MAREGLTRPQVFNAADQISAAGQQPTVAAIRAKLGTGSFTTITALLREWKEQATTPDDDIIDVPEEVAAALSRAGEIIWKAAQDHFKTELSTLKIESARQIARLTESNEEAFGEIDRLEKELHQITKAAESNKQLLQSTQDQLTADLIKTARLNASLRAAEERIQEQAALLARWTPPTPDQPEKATRKAAKAPSTPAKDDTPPAN